MAENKTQKTEQSVEAFLNAIPDPQRRADCRTVAALMKSATRAEPKMWGTSIVGFGDIHLIYESGRELDWFLIGFSPRKGDLTLYLGSLETKAALVETLGKVKTGKGCLYIKRLGDLNLPALKRLIKASVDETRTSGG